MKIEFLVATMNRDDMGFLETIFQNLDIDDVNALVINQCTTIPPPPASSTPSQNIRVISVEERGLSRSRNLALRNATGDVCVIVDDDCIMRESCLDDIRNAYARDADADIVTFGSLSKISKQPIGNFPRTAKKHRLFSIFGVASFEITFRRSRILERSLSFDERFGLGARFPVGEENIFLKDCMDSGLRLQMEPAFIVETDEDTTGPKVLTNPALRGKVFGRAFKSDWLCSAALAYTSVRKHRHYKHEMGLVEYFQRMKAGVRDLREESL